jgi:hypothetical protein
LGAWVVQEMVFARRILFLCGAKTLPRETMFRVGKLSILSGWTSHIVAPYLSMLTAAPGPPPGGVAVISQMREVLGKIEKPTLLDILISMRSRNTTDFRDKVYALLNMIAVALSTTLSRLPIQPTHKVECELAEVLESATPMCIRAAKKLSFPPVIRERKVSKVSECPPRQ